MRLLAAVALLLLSSSVLHPLYAVETRGLTVIAKDPATGHPAGEIKLYNKAWAVIIGIDRYQEPEIPRLKNAVNDAQGVKKVLQQRYRFDEYRELYDEKATRDNIRSLFTDELADKVAEDDAVFVFWAGHGTQQETKYGEIGELIPHDGSWKKHSRNFSMEELKTNISKILKARHVFYVMDACYGGLMADKRAINQKTMRDLKALQQVAKEDVRQVLTAGSKGEQVLDGSHGHSVFTYRLIEALEEAGDFVTANEIQAIITRNVTSDALKFEHKQTPQYGKLYGQGDFVFVPSREHLLAEKQAEVDRIGKEAERTRQENEKLKKQMADDEAIMAAALKAGDEAKRQTANLALKKKQGLQRLAEEKLREQQAEQQRSEREAAELTNREAERHRIQEEARAQQLRFQEAEERRGKEQAEQEQTYKKQKADEEQRNAELRRQGEEKRKKALAAAQAALSIGAAVEQIKRADAEIESINRDFDAELARMKAGADKRLAEKTARLKAGYDKRLLELKSQPAITVAKPVILPRDEEFETQAAYDSRVQKAESEYKQRVAEARAVGGNSRQAEQKLYDDGISTVEEEHRQELRDINRRITASRAESVKPFQERIAAIAAKEYPVPSQSIKLTIGKYDPEKEVFPVSIVCDSPSVNLNVDGKLSMPLEAAKQYKQHYTNGLVRVDAAMKVGSNGPVRLAMVNDGVANDAESYLFEYVNGDFINVESRKRWVELAGTFVHVPGGCFKMGNNFWFVGDSDEVPVHEVCLSDFAIGKFEVTQGQWRSVIGSNPSKFSTCGDICPVENVSWNDVQEFIGKLNKKTGMKFRLPTEAEWEYACRSGGKEEKYCGGNDADTVAWHEDNNSGGIHSVGQKQPNGLGIYDMSGNVWEWVNDWYGGYQSGRQQYPQGPYSGSHRVYRGGSWGSTPRNVRASGRSGIVPDGHRDFLGFRLAAPVQ